MRIDKWLWAARIFKTRSISADAVERGRVKLDGVAVKPAKEVKLGDRLDIRSEAGDIEIIIQGFNEQRRPVPEARLLYEETPESLRRRAELAELKRLSPQPLPDARGRPTKRDRRDLMRFRDKTG